MPEIGSSGLMSGDGKRGVGHRPQATAPILDSTQADIGTHSSRLYALESITIERLTLALVATAAVVAVAMLKRLDGQSVRRNATRSRFSSPVSFVPSTKLKNSTVSSSVSRRPSCK